MIYYMETGHIKTNVYVAKGYVYVADYYNSRIQKFNSPIECINNAVNRLWKSIQSEKYS
jgi:prefoldin subunit 5